MVKADVEQLRNLLRGNLLVSGAASRQARKCICFRFPRHGYNQDGDAVEEESLDVDVEIHRADKLWLALAFGGSTLQPQVDHEPDHAGLLSSSGCRGEQKNLSSITSIPSPSMNCIQVATSQRTASSSWHCIVSWSSPLKNSFGLACSFLQNK